MKNKKLVYILLPLTLVIWGGIIYQFFNFRSEEPAPVIRQMKTDASNLNQMEEESLLLNYRDPFLSTPARSVSVSPVRSASPRTTTVEDIPVEVPEWPEVEYKGLILPRAGSKEVGVVLINYKEKLVEAGDEIEGMVIQLLFPDSVITSLKGEKRTFYKVY